jgi:hypothetical protein
VTRPSAGQIAIVTSVAVTVMVMVGAFASVARTRPFRAIPNDAVVLFFSNCQFSLATFRHLEGARSSGIDILAVPLPGAPPALADAACDETLRWLRARQPSLRLLPAALACSRLKADAQAFYRQHFSSTPAFSVGSIPVPSGALSETLYLLGIGVRLSDDGARLFSRQPYAPRHAEPDATWTNQAVGW